MAKIAPSAIPDFTELLTCPASATENYWQLRPNDLYLGEEMMSLKHPKVGEHLGRLAVINQVYGAPIIDLHVPERKLRQQLRVRPEDKEISVPMVDFNTVCLYYSNPDLLRFLPLGVRGEAADSAYQRLGALNYARDLGHYLIPMVFSFAEDEPFTYEVVGPYGYEQWASDHLVELGDQMGRGLVNPGSKLFQFLQTLRRPEMQARGKSAATGMLLEIAEYFVHEQEATELPVRAESIERSDILASSALALAETVLRQRAFGSSNPEVELHQFAVNQLEKRLHDVRLLSIHRKVRSKEIDRDTASAEFAQNELRFLEAYKLWCRRNPNQDGLAYEWLTMAILNAGVYLDDLIGVAYARSSTVRENYPIDCARGKVSSCKQSHDVMYVANGQRIPIQCKTGGSQVYANPPIHTANARTTIGVNVRKPHLVPYFLDLADSLSTIYRKQPSHSQVWNVIDLRDRTLPRAA